MIKTKLLVITGMSIAFMIALKSPIYAEDATRGAGQVRSTIRQEIKTQVQEIKDERKSLQTTSQVQEQKGMNLLQRFMNIRAVVTGVITAKTDTTLTVKNKDGVSYVIHIAGTTVLQRKFWGKATLAEMQIGDTVNVIGKWSTDTKTEVNAQLIRDTSIQKRAGVFFGNVLSVTANGWTIQTARGTETVTITASTKLISRKEVAIKQGDIAIGHRIRVRGMWDSNANTLTEVTQVKDFMLPVVSTPKLTPTVTVTPTPAQ